MLYSVSFLKAEVESSSRLSDCFSKANRGNDSEFCLVVINRMLKSIFKKQIQCRMVTCTNYKCIAYHFFIGFINLGFETEVSEVRC